MDRRKLTPEQRQKLRQEQNYRMRLIEELHREFCARGLYKTVMPPDDPDPESDFAIAIDDMLHLLDNLPVLEPDQSFAMLEPTIKAVREGCNSDLAAAIPAADLFALMRYAKGLL